MGLTTLKLLPTGLYIYNHNYCVSVARVTVGFTEQEYTFFEDDLSATVTINTSFAPSLSFSVDIFSGKV